MKTISKSLAIKLFTLSAILFFLNGCNEISEEANVCINKKCFNVEVVSHKEEVQKGLMFRESMPEDNGMFFVFSVNKKHSFWMKNTYIALDMIWLDFKRSIVHIERNVPPCISEPCPTYKPNKDALYVLELNAHQAERYGIREGQVAQFNFSL